MIRPTPKKFGKVYLPCDHHKRICGRCRGVCTQCYTFYRREVEKGNITWEELERRGITQPLKEIGK